MSEPGPMSPSPPAAPEDPQQAFADGVRDRAMPTAEATQLMAFLSRTQSARQACPLLAPSAESLRTQAGPAASSEPPPARPAAPASVFAERIVQARGSLTASSASPTPFRDGELKAMLAAQAVILQAHGGGPAGGAPWAASAEGSDLLHIERADDAILTEVAAASPDAPGQAVID